MPQRSVATNFTFEQQRTEINLLADDFWSHKTAVDGAASTYLKHDGSNAFTGGSLAVPSTFTINSDSGNGTVTISGNLNVTGTTTTVNTTNLDVTDKNITIAKGNNADATADGAGITIDSDTDITWNFVDANDAWVSSIGVEATTFLKAARGQFTGATSPTTGYGVEINAPDANTGQIIAYNRDSAGYKELRLRASSVPIYTGTNNAIVGTFNSTGLTLESGKTLGVGVAPKSGEGSELAVKGSDGATNIALIPAADTEFSQIAFYNAAYDSQQGYIKYDNNDNSLQFRVNLHERFRIDSTGRLLVGHNATVDTSTYNSKLQVMSDDAEASITVGRFGDNASASSIHLTKSRGADVGSHTSGDLHDDDVIGNIFWWGSDGSDYEEVARIGAKADAAFTGSSTPGALTFWTTASNATTATERLRIHSDGKFTIGTTPDSTGYGQWAFLNHGTGGVDAPDADKGMCIRSDTGPTNNSVLSNTTFTLKLNNNAFAGTGVSGNTGTVVKLLFNGATSNGWNAYGAIGLDVQGTSGGKGDLFFNTGGEANGYERLRITNTGQVKIGNNPTIDANTNLHVQEETGECGVVIDGNTGGAGAYLLLKNRSTSSNPRTYISGIDAGGQGIAQIDFWNLDNDNNEGALSLSTRPSGGSMTPRLHIDSSGRVIIGDTDNANAHANADDLIIGNTGNDERSGITIVSDTDKDGAIHFSDGAGAGQLRGQIVYGHTFGSYSDVLAIYTGGSSSMLIQDDGDVVLGEIGGTRYTEGSTEAQLRVVGDADNGRPAAISLFGFGNTSNEAHARINFQQQTTGTNGQTTARIEAINRSGSEDASDLVFYTEKVGQDLKECARMSTRGELLINRTDAVSTNLSFDSLHLGIGGNYGPLNSYRTIGFGYRANTTSEYPASIGCQITDWAANTKAELVFATRNSTGQADVAIERLRIKADGAVNVANDVNADAQLNVFKSNGDDANYARLRVGYDESNCWQVSRKRNSGNIVVDANQSGAYVYHRTEGKDAAIITPTQVFATAKHASKVTAYSGINTAHWGDEAVRKFYASFYAGASSATYHVARMISQEDWGFDNIEIKVAKYQYNPTSDDLNSKQFTTYYGGHSSRWNNYNQQSSGSGTGAWNVIDWRQDFGPGGSHQIHNKDNGGYYRHCYGSDVYVNCGTYTGMRLEITVWATCGLYDCGTHATAYDFYPANFGSQASQTDADNWGGPRGTWFNSAPNGTGQGTNYGLFSFSTGQVYGEAQM